MNSYKVIVAHPGRQHSFRLATALKKCGMLHSYVTTVYDNHSFLMNIVKKLIKGDNLNRAEGRKCEAIDDSEVKTFCLINGLFLILLKKVDRRKILYNLFAEWQKKCFERKLAKYAIKNNVDAVVVYDTNAYYIGKYFKKHNINIKLIMDVSAMHRQFMRDIYLKDMEQYPKYAEFFKNEQKAIFDKKQMFRFNAEITYIDNFIVASDIVRKSLIASSIQENKIFIAAYGSTFTGVENKNNFNYNNALQLIYVGQVTPRKGIHHLLEAIAQYDINDIKLKLVGDYNNSSHIYDNYLKRCEFLGFISHSDLKQHLLTADIFIFPSLGDGFGFAAVEALSYGLPCIVSENAGISDYIENYNNGFIIPAHSSDAIVEKISWFLNNKDKLSEMSKKAIITANKLNWDNYNSTIQDIFNKIASS